MRLGYSQPAQAVIILAFCTAADGWYGEFQSLYITLETGHRLGARIDADGMLGVYLDDELLQTYDVSAFPHQSGRIGVNGITASGTSHAWDDFGGGDW